MMKCDLKRGYCLDGRLPCDLCDCFLELSKTPKRTLQSVLNYGGRIKYIYSDSPLRPKNHKNVPVDTVELNEDFKVSSLEKLSLEGEIPVKSQSSEKDCGRVMSKIRKKISRFIQFTTELICKLKGHDWETYAHSTGYYSYDVEQAGHCRRCHYDTHSQNSQSEFPMGRILKFAAEAKE